MTALSIAVVVKIQGNKRTLSRRTTVDTGFTMGLLLSERLARSVGAVLVRPTRLPTDITGAVIDGQSTIVRVSIPEAKAEAETLAFCPAEDPGELLLGMHFLARVGATLTIGEMVYEMAHPNPEAVDPYDLGNHVVPFGRPAR